MKTTALISLLLALLLSPTYGMPPENARRVVMIALDGISVAGFQKAHTPHLDALLNGGVVSFQTRVVMPSVTLPNWTSHLTGSGPEQHGVVDNSWEINQSVLPPVEKDSQGYYPSVFAVLKQQIPDIKTAFYYNWINLIYPYNDTFFDDVNYLQDDAYTPNYERAFRFILENKEAPTAVFLYSGHTDNAGHNHRWMSEAYIQSIEEADVEIGRFLDQMKAEGLFQDTHFMFLSDHGGIDYGHGGVTVDEMIVPWGIAGPGIKKGYTLETPNNTVNTAATVLHVFGIQQPDSWTGKVPAAILVDTRD